MACSGLIRFLLSGARAVELASAAITNGPKVFATILDDVHSYCERKQIAHISELIGKAADVALTYDQISPNPGKEHPWKE